MKQPTTPYSISVQEQIQINREFLLSEGWILTEEKPLHERFKHTNNFLVTCSIGLYGEFSICEWHWCNGTPERVFETLNPNLTTEDYFNIIKLLNIKL